MLQWCFFFFNDTATTEIYTLSLHDALPIYEVCAEGGVDVTRESLHHPGHVLQPVPARRLNDERHVGARRRAELDEVTAARDAARSEEHTSELQSRQYLVCRLLLEKKNQLYV